MPLTYTLKGTKPNNLRNQTLLKADETNTIINPTNPTNPNNHLVPTNPTNSKNHIDPANPFIQLLHPNNPVTYNFLFCLKLIMLLFSFWDGL